MQIKEIMSPSPEYISPNTLLKDAALRMRDLDTGFLPVGDKTTNKLVGTVTDRDIVIRALANNTDISHTSVDQIMTGNVLYCYEDEPVEKAAESMKKQQVRRLIVLDRNKNLAGIVSLGDVATHIKDHKLVGDVLESISE
ncbi:CBS domain-containing protein [Legionella israelensis]|uniref:CBS domain protein n=1 Tax=Legionella israelensis TaxID=454 RepID=A0A0W0WMT1_9GAMM|nr:CBS domain-containing protein [Legionella israelensis]KTD33632.1 CBS domain protein [Legionella israelensis]QBR84481.1 CBS domain-containing protein [Legionella israelensis]QBS08787.1 CBS domain-containing protein [Legionella israelensis]SCY12336.1 CBS domain-containing protein [Legionella israelensis DSM 19235]STX58464.1 CBS domain protein [Legionella israelensis]